MPDPLIPPPSAHKPKALRGFARLSPEARAEMAALGGRSVDPANRAYARDPALASRAGSLGGQASRRTKAKKGVPE